MQKRLLGRLGLHERPRVRSERALGCVSNSPKDVHSEERNYYTLSSVSLLLDDYNDNGGMTCKASSSVLNQSLAEDDSAMDISHDWLCS